MGHIVHRSVRIGTEKKRHPNNVSQLCPWGSEVGKAWVYQSRLLLRICPCVLPMQLHNSLGKNLWISALWLRKFPPWQQPALDGLEWPIPRYLNLVKEGARQSGQPLHRLLVEQLSNPLTFLHSYPTECQHWRMLSTSILAPLTPCCSPKSACWWMYGTRIDVLV